MRAFRYIKADAFTAAGSLGNPAACLYLEPGQVLSAREMQEIAARHKGFVSEVVYCRRDDGIHLTYYSAECEVDFCGHGTIAALYCLIREDPALLGRREIPITTNRKGALTVCNRIPEQDAVFITAPDPVRIGSAPEAEAVAAALGLPPSELDGSLPLDIIDAGLRTLLVPIGSLETQGRVFPDEAGLKAFCLEKDVDIVLLFSRETADPGCIAHTRVFAPRFGYLEDPATGSGNSAFGHYMRDNGLWDGGACSIEQGGADRAANLVRLVVEDGRLLFGGKATVRIDGSYYVD